MRAIELQCGFCTGRYSHNVGSNFANVGNWNDVNGINVNDWNADNGNSNLGAARWVVSSIMAGFAWWSESIRQASCLFLAGLFEVLNIFYLLLPGYLWQTAVEFLEGLILY